MTVPSSQDLLLLTEGDPIGACLLLADRLTADRRAENSAIREVRSAALASVRWQGADVRSPEDFERDARIVEFHQGWASLIGEADAAVATACAWPATERAGAV